MKNPRLDQNVLRFLYRILRVLPLEKWINFFLGPWLLVCQFIEISNQMELRAKSETLAITMKVTFIVIAKVSDFAI